MKTLGNARGKLPILMIVVVAVVVVGGLGVMKFVKGRKHGKPEKKPPVECTLWKMSEFTVNLADRDEPHYLKLNLCLEIEGKLPTVEGGEATTSPAEIKASDAIISVLTKKRFSELLTADGKEKMKVDLVKQLNESLEGIKVHNIYFTSFAMQ
jgi:flagellar protein FliL